MPKCISIEDNRCVFEGSGVRKLWFIHIKVDLELIISY